MTVTRRHADHRACKAQSSTSRDFMMSIAVGMSRSEIRLPASDAVSEAEGLLERGVVERAHGGEGFALPGFGMD